MTIGFSTLVNQANQWLQSQPPIDVINMQSLDYKLDRTWGKIGRVKVICIACICRSIIQFFLKTFDLH